MYVKTAELPKDKPGACSAVFVFVYISSMTQRSHCIFYEDIKREATMKNIHVVIFLILLILVQ